MCFLNVIAPIIQFSQNAIKEVLIVIKFQFLGKKIRVLESLGTCLKAAGLLSNEVELGTVAEAYNPSCAGGG